MILTDENHSDDDRYSSTRGLNLRPEQSLPDGRCFTLPLFYYFLYILSTWTPSSTFSFVNFVVSIFWMRRYTQSRKILI